MPTPTQPPFSPRLAEAVTRIHGAGDGAAPSVSARTVIGGYRVYEQVATGPLGRVYRARHLTGDIANVRFLAFVRPPHANEDSWPGAARSFSELLAHYAALEPHPALQRPVAWGQDGEVFWVAQEWVQGVPLTDFLHKYGPQSLPWALVVLEQIAAVLDSLADHGLWHSDLRPENILVARDETAGNAYQIRAILLNAGVAHAATRFGSPFAAPEQQSPVAGGGDGQRADIYALGTLLYFLLSGAPPFRGERPSDIAMAVTGAFPAKLTTVSEHVHAVLSVLLAKHPSQRYARASAAIADLAAHRSPDTTQYAAGIWGDGRSPLTEAKAAPSERDAKLLRRRIGRAQRYRAEAQLFAWATAKAWAVGILVFGGLVALVLHAARVPNAEETIQVLSVNGPANVTTGTRIGQAPFTVTTGKGGIVTLATRRVRLQLAPRSRLDVRELTYRDGAVLRAALRFGSVTAAVAPRTRDDAVELDTGKIRVVSEGGGLFVLTPRTVAVAAERGGGARVVVGDTQRSVTAGHQLDLGMVRTNAAGTTFVPEASTIGQSMRKSLAAAAPMLPQSRGVFLLATEDRLLVPTMVFLGTLRTYTTRVADDHARKVALDAMRSLVTLLERAKSQQAAYPPTIAPHTLRELGADPELVKQTLAGFAGNHLTTYRRLPEGKGYVVEARANDSSHSLVRGYCGSAYLPGNDDTALPH